MSAWAKLATPTATTAADRIDRTFIRILLGFCSMGVSPMSRAGSPCYALLFHLHTEIGLGRFAGRDGYLLLAAQRLDFMPDGDGIGPRRQAIDGIRPIIRRHCEEWMIEDHKLAIHPWMHIAFDAEFLRRRHRFVYRPAGVNVVLPKVKAGVELRQSMDVVQ